MFCMLTNFTPHSKMTEVSVETCLNNLFKNFVVFLKILTCLLLSRPIVTVAIRCTAVSYKNKCVLSNKCPQNCKTFNRCPRH